MRGSLRELRAGRGPLLLWVAAVVGAAVVFGLCGPPALVLVGCVAAGAGLTCFSRLPLLLEERLAYGAVAGPMVFSVVTFLLALVAGLDLGTVLLGLAVVVAGGALGWVQARARMAEEARELIARWRRLEPWPLWVLLVICWGFTLRLLAAAYRVTPAGLVAGNVGVYADWAAHLTFAGSFAYGANFPPHFPVYPGHWLTYPFMVDFWAATLVPLGATLTSSLVLTSGLLGLAFPAVTYLAWLRLAGSRAAAAVAVLLFVLGGGLGFVLLGGDIQRQGLEAIVHLPQLSTQEPQLNLQWLNPVLAWMLPQRSVLFGFALVPLALALLWAAREQASALPYAFVGVLAGISPIFHLHAYGTLVALAAFWCVLQPRRQWAAFFLPAVLLGAPVAAWMVSGGAASIRLQPGWLAAADGHQDNGIWFWIWNLGPFVPLMLIATIWPTLLRRDLGIHLAPIWLWFAVPNLVVLQAWDWDNTKFFAYWALLGSLLVAALLVRVGRTGAWGMAAAAVLFVLLTLSGGLDLARSLDQTQSEALFTDQGGLRAAAWARTHTEPSSVFLAAPDHNEPIPSLAGRTVMSGYPGWLWTYGFSDWQQRTADVERMLQGGGGTGRLVHRYRVRYVVLGPAELTTYHANEAYWRSVADVVYSNDGYTIYRIRAT